MSTVKTRVDAEVVRQFLQKQFDPSLSPLTPLKGGELSAAFSCSSQEGDLIVRVNDNPETFLKDRFAREHFCSLQVPIPEVIFIAEMKPRLHCCVTRRVRGVTLNDLDRDAQERLLPQLLSCLDNLHATGIHATSGYGRWDGLGQGMFSSWREAIRDIRTRTIVNADWYTWDQLFRETRMEEVVHARVCREIERLVPFLPEDRSLVHGDFGYDNVLTADGRVTAVLDWGEGQYGDPLYDIAWLDFHSQGVSYAALAKKHEALKGKPSPHFDDRLLCYELCIGLGSLGFCARAGKDEEYEATRTDLLTLLV